MTRCPFCNADLTGELAAVPPEVAKNPFPLRCSVCKYLLKVYPIHGGPLAAPLPQAEVLDFIREERKGPGTGEAAG